MISMRGFCLLDRCQVSIDVRPGTGGGKISSRKHAFIYMHPHLLAHPQKDPPYYTSDTSSLGCFQNFRKIAKSASCSSESYYMR